MEKVIKYRKCCLAKLANFVCICIARGQAYRSGAEIDGNRNCDLGSEGGVQDHGPSPNWGGFKFIYLCFAQLISFEINQVKVHAPITLPPLRVCFFHCRSTEIFPFEVEREHEKWSLEDDKTLIKFIDDISKNLSTSPQRLNAEEFLLEGDLTNPCFASLKRTFSSCEVNQVTGTLLR